MGEEGKVVSFLKGFTDRAFAGHLLRKVQANILRTATEVALEKETEREKEHQVMDEEPIEVGAAQTNQESADGFLLILETVQRHMGQLQACMDKQEPRTTYRDRDESTPWSKKESAGSIVDHAHRCAKDGEPEPQALRQQRTDREL